MRPNRRSIFNHLVNTASPFRKCDHAKLRLLIAYQLLVCFISITGFVVFDSAESLWVQVGMLRLADGCDAVGHENRYGVAPEFADLEFALHLHPGVFGEIADFIRNDRETDG